MHNIKPTKYWTVEKYSKNRTVNITQPKRFVEKIKY